MTNIDDSTAAVLGLLSFFVFIGLYVWVALALGAVFRKSGDEAWKAWVPIYNQVILLRLGGLSPWLLLLYLIPGLGSFAVWIIQVIACHQINREFGVGAGMTVLAALLFPVWASVLGWGSARWVGAEGARPGVQRSDASLAQPVAPARPYTPSPPPVYGRPPQAAAAATPQPAHAQPYVPSAPQPVEPAPVTEPSPTVAPPSGWAAPVARSAAPEDSSTDASASPISSIPAPAAHRYAPPPGAPMFAPASEPTPASEDGDEDDADWENTSAGRHDAPAPVSALHSESEASAPPVGVFRGRRTQEFETIDDSTLPPVTRVPAAPRVDRDRESWAPSDPDAFPEASGPVSAVAGAPQAGAPRSARASVSSFHLRPELPDEDMDETVIARRRRTDWSIVLPSGDAIPLASEVVLVGRRPAAMPEHPGAQLVAIDDGTVSKTHARLELRNERWYITDLGSTNGVVFSSLMGTEIEAIPGEASEAGDRFLLGDAEVRLVRSDG